MHLHNIFNVPQVVSETYDLIKDGRLLEAHRKYVGKTERERERGEGGTMICSHFIPRLSICTAAKEPGDEAKFSV